MKNPYDTSERWPINQAIAFLCCGSFDGQRAVKRWLLSGCAGDPDLPGKGGTAASKMVRIVKRLWGGDYKSLELHPVCWLWLGASKCRLSLHPTCLSEFTDYVEKGLAAGYVPMLRRVPGAPSVKHQPTLVDEDGTVALDIMIPSLLSRPFDRHVAERGWLTVQRPSVAPRVTKRKGKKSADSPNCITVLAKLLDDMAERGEHVVRLKHERGDLHFRSLELKRPALVDRLLASRGGAQLRKFAPTTRIRAMSAVVRTPFGRTSADQASRA